MDDATENYVRTHSKSQGISFILTLLIGPIGLFYSSWVAALILCVIAIAGAATIIVPILCWIAAIVAGAVTVSSHNDKVRATATLTAAGQGNRQ